MNKNKALRAKLKALKNISNSKLPINLRVQREILLQLYSYGTQLPLPLIYKYPDDTFVSSFKNKY